MGSWNILLGWWDKDSDDEDYGGKNPDEDKGDGNDDDDDEDNDSDDDDDDNDDDDDDDGGAKSDVVNGGGGEKPGDDEQGVSDLSVRDQRQLARRMAKKDINRKKRAAMSRHAKGLRMRTVTAEIQRIEELKIKIPGRIAGLNERIMQWNQVIDSKLLSIEELRAQFARIKGDGSQEDENFDMDNCSDENGHTFLMVAAQNNDLDTAQLCLSLHAQPDVRSPEGHTAMVFAYYFGFDSMITLIAQHGGTYPAKIAESWNSVERSMHTLGKHPINWSIVERIAQQAAEPVESAEALEKSEASRMAILPREERTRPALFFDSSIVGPKHVLRRVILLDESVYGWYFGANGSEKLVFVDFLDGLHRGTTFQCHRRAVVGVKNPYEVNCAALDRKPTSPVILFTPFVASVIDGVCDVGILVSSF
jgi:hypothetical protein